MNNRILSLIKGSLMVAGILLLFETLLGCVYVLGIGFSTVHDVITDLCLTMAFPVFLISLRSVCGSAIGLWIFFAIQWIDVCSNRRPPGFVNPLAWIHGDFLFAAAILVSVSAWILSRVQEGKRSPGLLDMFGAGGLHL
jgi:hypothetical protein